MREMEKGRGREGEVKGEGGRKEREDRGEGGGVERGERRGKAVFRRRGEGGDEG